MDFFIVFPVYIVGDPTYRLVLGCCSTAHHPKSYIPSLPCSVTRTSPASASTSTSTATPPSTSSTTASSTPSPSMTQVVRITGVPVFQPQILCYDIVIVPPMIGIIPCQQGVNVIEILDMWTVQYLVNLI